MQEAEWIKTLEDGRKVKFTYQELMEGGASISTKIEDNQVIYSIIMTKVRNPSSREDIEGRFDSELSEN